MAQRGNEMGVAKTYRGNSQSAMPEKDRNVAKVGVSSMVCLLPCHSIAKTA
jgi:hypothetical protein